MSNVVADVVFHVASVTAYDIVFVVVADELMHFKYCIINLKFMLQQIMLYELVATKILRVYFILYVENKKELSCLILFLINEYNKV